MTIDDVAPGSPSPSAAMEAVPGAGRVPAAPYMPGRAFTNMFEKYAVDGLPDVFDISFFGSMSGSAIAQIRSTMRYFDLIDDQYVPTDRMRAMVTADEDERKISLRAMVEEKFPDALALSQNATSGQLAKVFSERGISGATVDKAIAFYLHLLDYLGIPYSGNFKKRRSSNGASRRRRVTGKSEVPAGISPPVQHPKATTEQEQKAKYIDMLMQLAAKGDTEAGMQKDLLDRIEKALGIADNTPARSSSSQNQREDGKVLP